MLRLSLRRPTLGLVLAGALDGIMVLPLIGYETTRESRVFLLGLEMAPDRAATITIAALIVGLVLLVCALVLLVRPSRTLGWIAALAALVPHGPGSLVAIPSGVWMLAVLTGEDGGSDEARFEKPQPEPGPSAIAGDSRPGEPY